MTRSESKTVKHEDSEPEEWVVDAILKHRRKDGVVKYLVSWEACEENTWEPESNVGEGQAVEEYCAESETPLELFKPGSKAHREAAKALKAAAKPTPPEKRSSSPSPIETKLPKKRSRLSEIEDEEQGAEAGEQPEAGLVGKGGVKASRQQNHGLGVDGSSTQSQGDEGRTEIKEVETLEEGQASGAVQARLVWQDDSLSTVGLDIARVRRPQKVLDFMVSKLSWKARVDEDVDQLAATLFGEKGKAKLKKGSKEERLIESGTESSEVQQAVLLQAWDQLHKLDKFDPPLLSPSLTPLHHTASLYSSIRSLRPGTIDADSNTRLLHALLMLFQLASLETLGASSSATYQAQYLSLAARNVAEVLSWADFTGHEYSEAL